MNDHAPSPEAEERDFWADDHEQELEDLRVAHRAYQEGASRRIAVLEAALQRVDRVADQHGAPEVWNNCIQQCRDALAPGRSEETTGCPHSVGRETGGEPIACGKHVIEDDGLCEWHAVERDTLLSERRDR